MQTDDTRGKSDGDRRIRQANRLGRMLKILQLLAGQGRWDLQSLAERFEVSTRTIRRYLDVLMYAGIPYSKDKHGFIRILPNAQFPVLQLTTDEILEQATAAALSKVEGLHGGEGARVASDKLAAATDDGRCRGTSRRCPKLDDRN